MLLLGKQELRGIRPNRKSVQNENSRAQYKL